MCFVDGFDYVKVRQPCPDSDCRSSPLALLEASGVVEFWEEEADLVAAAAGQPSQRMMVSLDREKIAAAGMG